LATGIKLENSKNIRIFGGTISGFDKGIDAINSNVAITNTTFRRCNVAVNMVNSDAVFSKPIFEDNIIDLVVNRSSAKLINTLTEKIIAVTPKNDIRVNPFVIERMAIRVINTKDVREKRNRFSKFLKYLKKNYAHIWVIYSILKEIFRLAGYPI
jgi:hypothetical protein